MQLFLVMEMLCFFLPGIDSVSEKSVLVIHHAKDTSEKSGFKNWGFFGFLL